MLLVDTFLYVNLFATFRMISVLRLGKTYFSLNSKWCESFVLPPYYALTMNTKTPIHPLSNRIQTHNIPCFIKIHAKSAAKILISLIKTILNSNLKRENNRKGKKRF